MIGEIRLGMLFEIFDQPESGSVLDIRSLIPFLPAFGSLLFLKALFRREIRGRRVPAALKKIVESTDARDITREETAEDSKKGRSMEQFNPPGNGRDLKKDREQVGTEQVRRQARGRTVF